MAESVVTPADLTTQKKLLDEFFETTSFDELPPPAEYFRETGDADDDEDEDFGEVAGLPRASDSP